MNIIQLTSIGANNTTSQVFINADNIVSFERKTDNSFGDPLREHTSVMCVKGWFDVKESVTEIKQMILKP